MRAVVITRPGDPDVLEIREVDRPVPGPEEVLVRVGCSGVNRADLLQREGRYPAPPGWPADIPGLEFAGVVAEVGERCSRRSVGDRVMGIVGGGGYAELVTVDERATVAIPEGLSTEAAGAVPEVFITAFDAIFLQCGLKKGETLLVHAVGSGVGTAAVQLARAGGALTIGTSRTSEKLARAQELGLDEAVEADDGWASRVAEVVGEGGVDVILDLVGAPYIPGNLQVLATRGRWIVVGVPGGTTGPVDLRALMAKRASIIGTVLRARPTPEKVALAEAFEREVVPLFERGAVKPVVDTVYPAARTSEAHRRMQSNSNFGKLVLSWGNEPGLA